MALFFRMQLAATVIAAAALGGCGGGGVFISVGSGSPDFVSLAPSPGDTGAASTTYARSLVLGLSEPQSLVWRDALPGLTATLTAPAAGSLLTAGLNHVVADFRAVGIPGMRMACVSGRGESTGTFTRINLGVLAVSAAVLFDATWNPVDTESAWVAARQRTWSGWENCGVKAEGAPSPSSKLMPRADGGYDEDIYDGNPGTNFNILRFNVDMATARAMRSPAGWATTEDPSRPLVLTWRAWRNDAGQVVFVLRGEPRAGAPAGTRGFIAVYVPAA